MTVNIKDVARKANVSISTVSRVINDSKPVSDEIKKRVFDIIEETGYVPNPVARSLVMKKSRLIGIIVPDIANYYTGELLNAFEEIAKTYDYEVILCNTYGDVQQELRYLKLLESKQVEGMVFLSFKWDEAHQAFFDRCNLPVVLVNRSSAQDRIFSVAIDHQKAVYEMTSEMAKRGHKTFMLIRNGETEDVFGPDQLEGFRQAISDNGLSFDEGLVKNGYFQAQDAYGAVEEVLKAGKLPTAIITTTDDMAVGAINCLVDNGIKVPEEVSVTGFYDTTLATLYRPKLTTIQHPIYDIGAIAIRMIIKKIDGQEIEEKHVRLPHGIIFRESSR